MLRKAAYLCLAGVVATLLAAPIMLLVPWGINAVAAWVLFQVVFVCLAVALYRRWRPRVTGGEPSPH